ncbi:nucleoside-diphosphate-sugar epimerase [Thermosporothrix hazakensis]|jgi:nucleoside-diphosphate-sugar epimerase|uniref:UDP-glucose 4-epimerase n=2 Tax=Thermosporothrix TaxID=768650 RepID=A0A326U8A0_THEHA|nr:NAD(P)-dependent oxidoreductase [Thermosporothrix hazakensis]PZW29415.1 nucleoside-diphosphate-sugar epimerase [Thermosporothrix hazakensis]BBH85703.1 3-beta hydroxysteroid dehydrogenase [Thermosporothrix sp. COM3]GCE45868.1 3-beta hydroxysteroid dehydrogenase [Thermosporothrix hazakensis]
MKILLTGAFGNVGFHTLQELLKRGHTVRCFDLRNQATEKKARQIQGKAEIVWGNLTNTPSVEAAVAGQELIIHFGAIIPPAVDENKQLAYDVNVNGTRRIIEAAQKQPIKPRIFFSSTLDVFGHTQDKEPPRRVTDPMQATDDYSSHKIESEGMIRNSGLEWCIFRFADVPPLSPRPPHPIMFTIPLDTRFEMVHPFDVAFAVANAIERPVWGKILLIGGGKSCQVRYRDYLRSSLEGSGVGMLPEEAFGHEPYCTDWLDTTESQELLQYQRHSFEEIMRDVNKATRPPAPIRLIMPLLRPSIRKSILKMSPYWQARK